MFLHSGEVGRPVLLFFRGISAAGLSSGMGKQAGGAAVSHLLKSEMDLWLELSEGGRIFGMPRASSIEAIRPDSSPQT